MVNDLIERQVAIRKLKRMATQAYIYKLNGSAETIINCCIDVIERQIPSAQPERKKGKWIMKYKGLTVTSYKCSECGRTVKDDTGYDVSKDYPFCHCGADMREDQDGEND